MQPEDQQPHGSGMPGMEPPTLDAEPHEGSQAPSDVAGKDMRVSADPLTALDARISHIEEQTNLEFIRREARLIPSIINFWQHFGWKRGKQDPRSKAALSSLLWRFFSPGAAAAGAGGILLLIQTALLLQQNDKIDQQTHVMQAQANVAVATQIGPLLEQIAEYIESACLASSKEYPEISADKADDETALPRCWIDVRGEYRAAWTKECVERSTCNVRSELSDLYKDEIGSREHPGEQNSIAWTLPLRKRSQLQIAALAQMSRAYRFVDTIQTMYIGNPDSPFEEKQSPALIPRPLSPEKGMLLAYLLANGISLKSVHLATADFKSGYAYKPTLREAVIDDLNFVSFPLADMRLVKGKGFWLGSDFRCANFQGANLSEISVYRGDYSGANFAYAILPSDHDFSPSQLKSANFENAQAPSRDFLKEMAAKKIPGFDPTEWIVEEDGAFLTISRKDDRKRLPTACT